MKGGNIMKLLFRLKMLFLSDNKIFYINGNETLPPPLTKDEECKIMRKITNGDEKAREPLIVHNLRLDCFRKTELSRNKRPFLLQRRLPQSKLCFLPA